MARESVAERHKINQHVVEEFRANGGQVGGRYEGWDLVLLNTIGARTGEIRTIPLGYDMDGDRIVIIAARGGSRYNPDWYHNLLAHPVITAEVGNERFKARAIVTQGEERERLIRERNTPGSRLEWYLQRTSREIPVIVLERIGPAD